MANRPILVAILEAGIGPMERNRFRNRRDWSR
jgi:hypothetical protein